MSDDGSEGILIGVESDENDFQSMDNIVSEHSSEEEVTQSRKRKLVTSSDESDSPKKVKKSTTTKKTAAKKSKTEKGVKATISDKDAPDVLLNYINEQNKPFNANTIFENLHKEIKKPSVVRILADLAKKGKIIEKEYGKLKVYFANQDQFPVVDEKELKQMDEEITNLMDETEELKTSIDVLRSQLKELDSSMTDEALEQGIASMMEENRIMEERIKSLQSADTIDPKQLEILRSEISKLEKLWRKRRNQCKEMIGNIAEGLDKKDSEVCEMIGIETEEELGLSLPFKK